jgi:hypothetical protein
MMIPENAVKGEWHVLRFEYLSIWQKMQVILEDALSAIHIIQFSEHIYFFPSSNIKECFLNNPRIHSDYKSIMEIPYEE